MRKITVLSFSFFLLPLVSLAALLDTAEERGVLEGVKLYGKANLGKTLLQSVGAGLRYKKVVFVKANVYVGELFVSQPSEFKSGSMLDSLDGMNAVAMQMTFLRNVDGPTLASAFSDAFEENGVDVKAGAARDFLAAVKAGGPAAEGKGLVVAGSRAGEEETVSYENAQGKVVKITGPRGFRRQVLSLWLGKPVDSGVENLQEGIRRGRAP